MEQGFFQDFLLGPVFAEKIEFSWTAGSLGRLSRREAETCAHFSVVEMQCVKAGALRDTINWLKMGNVLFFLCCEMNSSHFLLNFQVFNWKLICTRHEFLDFVARKKHIS
jgi:hypothetical protein